jgi:hypothetical protein
LLWEWSCRQKLTQKFLKEGKPLLPWELEESVHQKNWPLSALVGGKSTGIYYRKNFPVV